jgi:hypothetical protein
LSASKVENEDAQEQAARTAKAIAEQEAAIKGGRVKEKESPVDGMIRQAQEQIAKLRFGDTEAKLMGLELGGENPAKIAQLRQELSLQESLKKAADDKKKAEEDAKQAAEKQRELQKQGQEQIAGLKDQMDLLSGAATKADIAMRQALREGLSRSQAEEIKVMTEEIEALEKKKTKTSGPAAFAALNSRESYSTILRTMQGDDKSPEKETARNTARMVKLFEQAEKQAKSGRQGGLTLNDINQA